MCFRFAVILLVGSVAVSVRAEDVPPEPDALVLSASQLVNQLGDDSYALRHAAAAELEMLGGGARQALMAGLSSGDAEVRRSCRRILADILENDYQQRVSRFVADKDGKLEHDLPGWDRYQEMVGSDANARQLFVQMQDEERGLMASTEAGAGAASDALQMRFRQVYLQMNQRDQSLRREPTLGTLSAMLFVASNPDFKIPPEVTGHSYWSSFIGRAGFQTALQSGQYSPSARKILGSWILAEHGQTLIQRKLMLAIQFELPEGLELAFLAVKDKTLHANYRSYGIQTIVNVGGKEYAQVIADLLEDKSVCTRRVFRVNNQNKIVNIELRDIALAWLVHLTGQDHTEYGMPNAKAQFDRIAKTPQNIISVSVLGFSKEEDRDVALKKWSEYVAKNPLAKLPEKAEEIAKITAERLKTPQKPINNAAFNPLLGLAPKAAEDGRDAEEELQRADRQMVRQIKSARTMIAAGEYADAALFLGNILMAEEDYTFQPVRSVPLMRGLKAEASRLIADMPAAGKDAYRLHFEPYARRELLNAIAAGDVPKLSKIADQMFHTEAGAQATFLLGTHYVDYGRPLRGAFYLDRLRTRSDIATQFEPTLSVKLASAWYLSGLHDKADELLRQISHSQHREIEVAGEKRPLPSADGVTWLEQFLGNRPNRSEREGWAMYRGDSTRNAIAHGEGPFLRGEKIADGSSDSFVSNLIRSVVNDRVSKQQGGMPATHPLLIDDIAIIRTADRMAAYDFTTNEMLWDVAFEDALRHVISHSDDRQRQQKKEFIQQGLTRRLWGNLTFGTMSSDGRLVFGVEELSFGGGGDDYHRLVVTPDGKQRLDAGVTKHHSRLAAYSVRTGKLVWEAGGPSGANNTPLAGVFFLGPPLPFGGKLYALGTVGTETRLMELDADTGALMWDVTLDVQESTTPMYVSPYYPAWLLEDPARRSGATPSSADGILVCPTSHNNYVALDLTTRDVLWMYRTEEDETGINPQFGVAWQQQLQKRASRNENDYWADGSVTIAGRYVLITPADSGKLYCLNLRDGSLQWTASRRDAIYVAGVEEQRVLLVGVSAVWALDLNTGEPVWNPELTQLPGGSVPSGRGFVSDGKYHLPMTTSEVISFDIATGELLARSRAAGSLALGNLVSYRDWIVSQSPDGVFRFPSLAARDAELQAVLEEAPQNFGALVDRGEVLLYRGQLMEAVDHLGKALDIRDDQRARMLLTRTIIEGIRKDFDTFAALAASQPHLSLEDSKDRAFIKQMAESYSRAGKYEKAFEALTQLLEMEPEPTKLEHVAATRQVRRDRWLQSRFAELLAAGDEKQAAIINHLAQQKLSQNAKTLHKQVFGWSDAANAVLLNDARDHVSGNRFLEAEQLLRRVVANGDDAQQREAIALLAQTLTKAEKHGVAAACYARLQQTAGPDAVCLDGNTADQLIAALPQDSPVRRELNSPRVWPQGAVKKTEKKTTSSISYNYPVAALNDGNPFNPEWMFEIDTSGRNFFCIDENGKNAWTVALTTSSSNYRYSGAVFSYARAKVQGHLVVLWIGDRIFGIDAMSKTPKILWRIDTTLQRPLYPGMAIMPPAWMRMVRPLNEPLGDYISPVAFADGVVLVQRERTLLCADTLTGKTLWSVDGVREHSDIFGDDDRVFVNMNNADESVVLSTLDGRELGRRASPPHATRLAVVGARILTWEEFANGGELALFDPWTNEHVWKRNCAAKSQVWMVNENEVAVLNPAGQLSIANAHDGRNLITAETGETEELQGLLVWKTADGYLMATDRKATDPGLNPFGVTAIMGSVPVNGLVAGIDATGKVSWKTEVTDQMTKINQPANLPVMAFLNMLRVQQGNSIRTKFAQACIDRRNGKELQKSMEDGSNNLYEVVGDPAKGIVEMKTRTNVTTFTFEKK